MRKTIQVDSPVGMLYVSEENHQIVRISRIKEKLNGDSELLEKCRLQLNEYFAGKRKQFDLPLSFAGTEFQISVWKAMQKIEYGTCVSYQMLAEMAGVPKAVRAVGTACGHNPIGIVIPCHRVIRSDHTIGQYAWGTKMKQFLIELERRNRCDDLDTNSDIWHYSGDY